MNNPKFDIHCLKSQSIDLRSLEKQNVATLEDIQHDYNPFHIEKLQSYNPIYDVFFNLNEDTSQLVCLNHKYHVDDLLHITNYETREQVEKNIHIKYAPLIDPLKYMIGKYVSNEDSIYVLPTIGECESHPKFLDVNNSSYVDNFFSFLCSKLLHVHGFKHGVDYYGSFLGIQNKFKMNVIDDLDYLSSSDYFKENINKKFFLADTQIDEFMNFGSRSNKQKLVIDDVATPIEVDSLDIEPLDNGTTSTFDNNDISEVDEVVYEKSKNNSETKSSIDSSNNSQTNYSDNDLDDESDNDSDDDSENDSESVDGKDSENWTSDSGSENESSESYGDDAKYAYINKFPVQLICLEKCDGTLDELFETGKIDVDEAASVLFQVIMILITYQKVFYFTHNDLHTNNIMYVETDVEYLYYKYKNVVYKVPTYGKIYKLIDFGRGIYRFHGKQFCSDSFAAGGDAATQYNCEPYMNENKARLDPNYSFDLCRLGCSIYDFIIDSDDKDDIEQFDALQKTIYRWCTDDNGKNILYMRNGDERYPGFKLYKMIARSVHKHTPENQLEFKYFKQFAISSKKSKNLDAEDIMDIDGMPTYV
jgi:hypothetical protein